MKVKALQKYYYDRHEYQPGEEFVVDDREAMNIDILCKLGKLELVKESKEEKAIAEVHHPDTTTYETAAVEPEQEHSDHQTTNADRKRYRRRDMRSES